MTTIEPGRIRAEGLGRKFTIAATGGRSLRASLLRYEQAKAREFWALRGVSLDIAPGEAFGIVGRNGSGKSTLLKMLARIYGPTEGSCEVGGRMSSLLELGAGFHPEFSAIENIYLSSSIYGIPRQEIHRDLDSIIDFAELEDFVNQPVKTFSSGMFARLGFSVAMHVRPDVLLLDEVLAVGDEAFVQKCLERIAEFRRGGGTMVIVTHDAGVVERICDRALLLEGGLPVVLGAATDVIHAYHERLARDSRRTPAREPAPAAASVFSAQVEIIDASGASRQTYTEGEPFTVRATVRAASAIGPVDVNIEFKDAVGRPLTGNTLPRVVFEAMDQRTFELVVATPPFRDGVFAIAFSITDCATRKPYMQEEAIETLSVIGDSTDTGGSIRLHGRWQEPA